MRQTTVATIGILVAFGLAFAPAATANHQELSQSKDYINPGHPRQGFVSIFGFNGFTLRIDCDGSLAGVGINCVEFELTGAEHEVDIQIADTVLDQSRRHSERGQTYANNGYDFIQATADPHGTVDALAGSVVDSAQADVRAAAGSLNDEDVNATVDGANADVDTLQDGDATQDAVNALADDTVDWRPVSAVYQIRGAHGSGAFCNTEVLVLPPDANSLRVIFDGVGFGNAFLSRCGTTFSGAIAGSVFLNVEVDP